MAYNQQYPQQPNAYPQPQQGYPQQGYPQQAPGYPQPAPGYPQPAPGYPQQQQYPTAQPVASPGYSYKPPSGADQMQAEGKANSNRFEVGLLGACCKEPVMCLFGFCCGPCCTCKQRKRLLMDDMSRYMCCAGMWGPKCTGYCNKCTKDKESCCLCLEACCCLGCAVHGNRYMVMQHYGLQNDCIDVAIMWCACICQIIACLCGSEELKIIADCFFYMVMGCMLAQHEHQLNTHGYPKGSLLTTAPH